jgi:S1-C subfamily serine protease
MSAPHLVLCAALLCWVWGAFGAGRASAAPPAPPASGAAAVGGADWAQVIAAVSPAVVSVRMDRPIAFDTDAAGNSYATGFVVDAERGILLTNRHVVGAGPARAEAVFLNNEEVPLQPLYRDPVHDFGFYRFDPAALRYQARVALPLDPAAAKVGLEVRVIGNDAGEKISILSGTIARLDRPAPVYGRGRYNDFNTFYIQAASGTSGGSSGSPVIGPTGAVVALNAGANRSSAASFFLPLDRVVRALGYVQRGERPPRGTWRLTLAQRSWDELRRLGLSAAQEASLRAAHPAANGLLVVDEVLPGAEAEGLLAAGDILVQVEGQPISDYNRWEGILDDHVGQPLEVLALRGGLERRVRVPTGDLHAITPESWVEVGGAVLHPLSYQKALGFAHPVEGLFLADRGYLFEGTDVPAGAVLRAVDGAPVTDLDGLWLALGRLPDRQPFIVRYTLLSDPGRERLAQVWMDRRWSQLRRCAWSQAALGWPCVDAAAPPAALEPAPVTTAPLASPDRRARRALNALVMVEHTLPMGLDGVLGRSFRGAGVVIDAEAGWVLTDRDTVPSSIGDVRVVLAGRGGAPRRSALASSDRKYRRGALQPRTHPGRAARGAPTVGARARARRRRAAGRPRPGSPARGAPRAGHRASPVDAGRAEPSGLGPHQF